MKKKIFEIVSIMLVAYIALMVGSCKGYISQQTVYYIATDIIKYAPIVFALVMGIGILGLIIINRIRKSSGNGLVHAGIFVGSVSVILIVLIILMYIIAIVIFVNTIFIEEGYITRSGFDISDSFFYFNFKRRISFYRNIFSMGLALSLTLIFKTVRDLFWKLLLGEDAKVFIE